MDYNQMALFVAVVEAGSLSEAARRLNMAKSNLSRGLTQLEKSLGTQLVYRNTRNFQPTEAGRHLYQLCRDPLFQIRAATETIQHDQNALKGKLIITMAVDLVHTLMSSQLAEFVKRYPKIELDIRAEDRTVDLVKEGVDLALRFGPMVDSNLKALKIGEVSLIFVCTPGYLNSTTKIRTLEQLEEQPMILFNIRQEKQLVVNRKTGLKTKLKLQAHVMMNTPITAKTMAMGGCGIALLPDFICLEELKSGQLIRVMPDWSTEPSPFHYVWPSHIAQSPKVKAFIDLTHAHLKNSFTSSL